MPKTLSKLQIMEIAKRTGRFYASWNWSEDPIRRNALSLAKAGKLWKIPHMTGGDYYELASTQK